MRAETFLPWPPLATQYLSRAWHPEGIGYECIRGRKELKKRWKRKTGLGANPRLTFRSHETVSKLVSELHCPHL